MRKDYFYKVYDSKVPFFISINFHAISIQKTETLLYVYSYKYIGFIGATMQGSRDTRQRPRRYS